MAYVRQAIGRILLLKQIKRTHEKQTSAVDKQSLITMGKLFFNDSEGQHSSTEEIQNLSDESNFDEKEDHYDTDSSRSSERTGSESNNTPNRDDEYDSDSNSDDSSSWLETVAHNSSENIERCFSSIYYLLAGRGKQPQTNEAVGNVARAMIGVHAVGIYLHSHIGI